MYFKHPDEKVVGFFRSTTPELIIRDPEIIKKILISDFSYFYGRGFHPYKRNIEKLIQNLFFVEGDLWKMLRIQMTPAFTSGKLKAMFPLIVERAENLQQRTLLAVKKNLPIDARELTARFTTDFIGACGFGLDKIQKKVQNEIDEVLKKHDNKLSYAAVKEMTCLEWTFKEAMRIFPSLDYLIRECTRKYIFEDLGFSIDEGVKMMISVAALHKDPKYWHNPEEFRPERFSREEFTNVKKDVYLVFGDGPRVCIGARLGLMQSLAGLAAILSKFSFTPAPERVRRPPVVPTSDIVQNINVIPLMFHERH
ncbi:unnamed protein product [Diatraea saccharalis]|uniref:unspecific monooxygenase n=1 Tax=Diatraea saccharalis TaxID=40085 RepID=A0A9N9WIM0_9NEOP|nr:unnamed protein product [Diatraea saccharalis]